MFSIDAHTRVYIAAEPVDFRRQIDGLAMTVQETLEQTHSVPIYLYFATGNAIN